MKAIASTLLLVLVSALIACSKDSSKLAPNIAEAWIKANPEALIADVRTPDEFASGHLARAVLITWSGESTAEFTTAAKRLLDPDKPILVYCRSGRRSALAIAKLRELGFTNTRELDGGLTAWQKANKPIVQPK